MHSESPVNPVEFHEYGSPPEGMAEELEKMCKGKTIQELRQLGDYFNKKASDINREAEKSIKIEDYDKLLKKEEVE